MPTAIIDYGTTYDALSAQIISIADANPTASGADNEYVIQVAALVNALETSVAGIITTVDSTATKLTTWQADLQTAHDNLSTGASSIQSAETDLETDISKMNNAISALNDEIAAENKAIAYSAMAIGGGVFFNCCWHCLGT